MKQYRTDKQYIFLFQKFLAVNWSECF